MKLDAFDVLLGLGTLLVAGGAWSLTGQPAAGAVIVGAVMAVLGILGAWRR